jgi:hypothetical protein
VLVDRLVAPRDAPDWLGSLRLEGLRVGDASVTLNLERGGDATSFTLADQRGELDVTMAAGG